MIKNYLIILIMACLIISGCSGKEKKQVLWGVYQEPVLSKSLPKDLGVNELKVLWKKHVGSGAELGFAIIKPAFNENNILISNTEGGVFRLDASSGQQIWRTNLDQSISTGVGVGQALVVVGHDNGYVSALNFDDGSVRWSTSVKRQISAIPVVTNGRVLIRTSDGLILALDNDDGAVIWKLNKGSPSLTMHGDSIPAVTGDVVLVGLSNGNLIANNVLTGRDYWETELSFSTGNNDLERLRDVDTPPVIRGSNVYTATYNSSVMALDIFSAQVIWRTKLSTRLALALSESMIFVTSDLGEVVALDMQTGKVLWRNSVFKGHGVSAPVVVGNRVVVGDSNGKLHTLDMQDGHLVETKSMASGALVNIVSHDNQGWAFSSKGILVGFQLP